MPFFAVNYVGYDAFCATSTSSGTQAGTRLGETQRQMAPVATPTFAMDGDADEQQLMTEKIPVDDGKVLRAQNSQGDPNNNNAQQKDSFLLTAKACASGKWTQFYDGIQHAYWGVGWFSYYTPNQAHNFIIAAPMFLFVGPFLVKAIVAQVASRKIDTIMKSVSAPVTAHQLYLLAMLLVALTRMHVQVVNRFVMSAPALYLVLAERCAQSMRFRFILSHYCAVWLVLGCALFANFYPWT